MFNKAPQTSNDSHDITGCDEIGLPCDKKYLILRFALYPVSPEMKNTLYFAHPFYYYHHEGEKFDPDKIKNLKDTRMTPPILKRSAEHRGYIVRDCTADLSLFHAKKCYWCDKPIDTTNKRRPASYCSKLCKHEGERFLMTFPDRFHQIEEYVPEAPLIESLTKNGLYHEHTPKFPIDREYALEILRSSVFDSNPYCTIDKLCRELILKYRKCEVCGKHIPEDKPIQSRFCSDECRKHASYMSKKEREKKED